MTLTGNCVAKQPLRPYENDLLPGSASASSGVSRRGFIRTLAMGIGGALLLPADEVFAKAFSQRRQLAFHHLHTDEKFNIVCCPGRRYDKVTLNRFSQFLRDHHTDQFRRMDAGLLDLMVAVAALTHSQGTIQVLCGYRSPSTNAALYQSGSGVAEHSLHIQGRAMDVRLSDVSTNTLHRAGLALQHGGVGYYRQLDFVHLDTGKFRAW